MTSAAVAGLLAGFGIAVPVGAVGAYLVSLSARTSFGVGSAAGLGVATVDGGYALLAVLGGGALLDGARAWAEPLRWTSVVVLVLVAVHLAVGAWRRHVRIQEVPASHTPLRAYLALVAMTSVNPTTVVYFAAIVVGGGAAIADTAGERLVFVLAATAASASWQLSLAACGTMLGRALTGRRGQLVTAAVSSFLIVVLAARTVLG
ncbi:hypothetical protein EIL87_01710 [Saccharopolyspora rhizosphaerae]|uniref:Lysine transporter LysE n=1 Tax=Saccharopolyspora rhizosphaerae TaxID=2492662 RepID=A0A426K5D3_9PSEU|nr:LysE family transporter [Saccharopolyspora rhizosphaerae]RRO20616.1 hypothetical protein EIL87_01710 [Saccharopolyspora rhizosphaerae]